MVHSPFTVNIHALLTRLRYRDVEVNHFDEHYPYLIVVDFMVHVPVLKVDVNINISIVI